MHTFNSRWEKIWWVGLKLTSSGPTLRDSLLTLLFHALISLCVRVPFTHTWKIEAKQVLRWPQCPRTHHLSEYTGFSEKVYISPACLKTASSLWLVVVQPKTLEVLEKETWLTVCLVVSKPQLKVLCCGYGRHTSPYVIRSDAKAKPNLSFSICYACDVTAGWGFLSIYYL